MKKIIATLSLLSITILFIGCSSDDTNEDAALFQKVQGKWKLTSWFTDYPFNADGNPVDLTIANGYEMELKGDHTFTSNEIAGYTGGKYTVINNPGPNIRLVYKNSSGQKIIYKYIIGSDNQNMSLGYPEEEAIGGEVIFFEGQVLTKVP